MPIDLYPNISKVKRNGAWQNLPGFVAQSGDADIEAMLANKETSTTAQFAHAKDSFFILNDVLYQADVNISVNDTIAVGTNCHVAVLGDEVTELINEITLHYEKFDELMKAILNCFQNVVYTSENGEFYYNKLESLINDKYTFFDYIEYVGGYYASTDGAIIAQFTQSSNYTIQAQVYYSNSTQQEFCPVFGNRINGVKNLGFYVNPKSKKIGYWWGTIDTVTNIPIEDNVLYTVIFKPVGKSQTYPSYATITLNDVEYSTGSTVTGTSWGDYFGIFSPASTGTESSQGIVPIGQRIGRIIVKDENDELVADLNPAYDGEHYGFLDKVSMEFYYNEAHNDFYTGGNWS